MVEPAAGFWKLNWSVSWALSVQPAVHVQTPLPLLARSRIWPTLRHADAGFGGRKSPAGSETTLVAVPETVSVTSAVPAGQVNVSTATSAPVSALPSAPLPPSAPALPSPPLVPLEAPASEQSPLGQSFTSYLPTPVRALHATSARGSAHANLRA